MKNDILPIGSVITVGGRELMICSYFNKNIQYKGEKYDYVCCLYPVGLMKETALIKKEKIEKVNFIGYQNEKFVELKHMIAGDKNE